MALTQHPMQALVDACAPLKFAPLPDIRTAEIRSVSERRGTEHWYRADLMVAEGLMQEHLVPGRVRRRVVRHVMRVAVGLRTLAYPAAAPDIGEGGRLVRATDHAPLCTYLKSDVGVEARVVAASNRVLRRKHRSYYSRAGAATAREVRVKQHALVARFYAHNGKPLGSALYRLLAYRAARTRGVLRRARRAVAGQVRFGVRRVVVALARLARPFMPAVRRTIRWARARPWTSTALN
jgi:hypothetical protein